MSATFPFYMHIIWLWYQEIAHNGLEYTSHKVSLLFKFSIYPPFENLKKTLKKKNLAYYIFSHDLGAIILVWNGLA